MTTKRQQIVDAIVDRLKTIIPGKVFTLDSGSYTCQSSIIDVYPWRKTAFSAAELPAIRLEDADADVEPGASGQHEHKLHLSLEGAVLKSTTAAAARAMVSDVLAAIGSDVKWGGLARWTDINSHSIDLEQAGDIISGFQILITVTYRTPLWRM